MEMTPVAKASRRLVRVRLDWGAFDGAEANLDEVRCRWEASATPRDRQHGAGSPFQAEPGQNDNIQPPARQVRCNRGSGAGSRPERTLTQRSLDAWWLG